MIQSVIKLANFIICLGANNFKLIKMTIEALLSQRKLQKTEKDISNRLLSLDAYGKPVSLTFRGQDRIKTPIGAAITIFIALFLFGFGIHRWFSTLSNNVTYVPLHRSNIVSQRSTSLNIDAAQLFAFGFGDKRIDKSVGSFKLVRLDEGSQVIHEYEIVACDADAMCRDTFS